MIQKANLFGVDFTEINEPKGLLSINTPLGEVVLKAMINGVELSNFLAVGKLKSDHSRIYILESTACHLEILKMPVRPKLPLSMSVDGCVVFLLRFKGMKHLNASFTCSLFHNTDRINGEPESGEGLVVQTFHDANFRVSIGTEDGEFLSARAEYSQWLPRRYFSEEVIDESVVQYLRDGIQVSLPFLQENEQGQIQFIVSWSNVSESNPSATWFAVGLSPKEILQQGGLV